MGTSKKRGHVNAGYPFGELARAFVTATTAEDARTRKRATARVERWQSVLAGMEEGRIGIGSRKPVAEFPEWVTLEVIRGGFATGAPAAGGPLRPHELAVIERTGIASSRAAVFAYHLSDAGLAELNAMLDNGSYRVTLPEEAALLMVAWLLREGDALAALALLDQLQPYAGTLCFAPVPGDGAAADASLVWRETAGDAHAAVSARGYNERVEANREALAVWNPFADELLALWLETVDGGRVAAHTPPGWLARGTALLSRYRTLALRHTRCTKHLRPKENLAILRSALESIVASGSLPPRRPGLLQHAVDSMVRRRGVPGSPGHAALRTRQAAEAAVPARHALSQVVAARLAVLPSDSGVRSIEALIRPVDATEADEHGVPVGTGIPESIRAVVQRASAGTVEELVERGVVPSAEVLARLVPRIAATTTAMAYPDAALQALMAAVYEAFRNRRSLLLLNLEHQVRLEELPWVAAVEPYVMTDAGTRDGAQTTLVRLGGLALDGFPATVLPNPFIRELDALSKAAALDLPWVEELAADIFAGTFSAKFLRAAKIAGEWLSGSLYERYYGIDYAWILAIPEDGITQRWGVYTSPAFDALCQDRSGASPRGGSVASSGMVIEQAQILTTQNLATIAGPLGAAPSAGWRALAGRAFETVCRLVVRVHDNPSPRGMIKDAAYAWRHTIFFLSLASAEERDAFVRAAAEAIRRLPGHAQARLEPVVAGLEHVHAGGKFTANGDTGGGRSGGGRRFLGWADRGHWMRR